MTADILDYATMMQRALRGVVREALGVAAEQGLPEGHHFYIAFDTNHPGVDMPDWLHAQFPQEITIVLEHEFWDLAVAADRFTVSLSFSNRAAHLTVPLDAVRTFVDPHAEFGLKFDPHEAGEDDEELEDNLAEKLDLPSVDEADAEDGPEPPNDAPKGGADVVSLDRFRKH